MQSDSDNRHLRQIILPEIGQKGQSLLRKARVLVIGAGGLGSPALYYLAAAGVGTLHIVDDDVVSLSNLNRQILFCESDLGRKKAECACARLHALDGSLTLIPHAVRLGKNNIRDLCRGMDVIVDCVDNVETRQIVNRAAVAAQLPLVEGGIHAMDGYLFPILPHQTACYACMQPEPAVQAVKGPLSVLGAAAGMLGAMQAGIALRMLLGLPVPAGAMHIYSLTDLSKITIPVPRNPNCPVCGGGLNAD